MKAAVPAAGAARYRGHPSFSEMPAPRFCAAPTAARIKILVRLLAEGLACGENHADTARADSGGDALDAMIACLAAWRVAEDSTLLRPRDRLDAIEARVWF